MNRSVRLREEYKYELLNGDEEPTDTGLARQSKGPLQRMRLLATTLVSLAILLTLSAAQFGTTVDPSVLDACPGYEATDVKTTANGITAGLVLAGKSCNVFGEDVERLSLEVTYETGTFLVHIVLIEFAEF